MKYLLVGVLLFIVGCVTTPEIIRPTESVSQARTPCGDRTKITERLWNVYAEEPVSIGLMVNGSIIEVYASYDGTFTVLITSPEGLTCLVATGDNWEQSTSRKPQGEQS